MRTHTSLKPGLLLKLTNLLSWVRNKREPPPSPKPHIPLSGGGGQPGAGQQPAGAGRQIVRAAYGPRASARATFSNFCMVSASARIKVIEKTQVLGLFLYIVIYKDKPPLGLGVLHAFFLHERLSACLRHVVK